MEITQSSQIGESQADDTTRLTDVNLAKFDFSSDQDDLIVMRHGGGPRNNEMDNLIDEDDEIDHDDAQFSVVSNLDRMRNNNPADRYDIPKLLDPGVQKSSERLAFKNRRIRDSSWAAGRSKARHVESVELRDPKDDDYNDTESTSALHRSIIGDIHHPSEISHNSNTSPNQIHEWGLISRGSQIHTSPLYRRMGVHNLNQPPQQALQLERPTPTPKFAITPQPSPSPQDNKFPPRKLPSLSNTSENTNTAIRNNIQQDIRLKNKMINRPSQESCERINRPISTSGNATPTRSIDEDLAMKSVRVANASKDMLGLGADDPNSLNIILGNYMKNYGSSAKDLTELVDKIAMNEVICNSNNNDNHAVKNLGSRYGGGERRGREKGPAHMGDHRSEISSVTATSPFVVQSLTNIMDRLTRLEEGSMTSPRGPFGDLMMKEAVTEYGASTIGRTRRGKARKHKSKGKSSVQQPDDKKSFDEKKVYSLLKKLVDEAANKRGERKAAEAEQKVLQRKVKELEEELLSAKKSAGELKDKNGELKEKYFALSDHKDKIEKQLEIAHDEIRRMTESNSLYDTRYNSPSQSANNQIKPQLLMNTNCNPQQQPLERGDTSQSVANPFMHTQQQPQGSNQYHPHHHQPAQYPQNFQAPPPQQQQQSLQPVVQQQNQSGSQPVVVSPINISIPNRPPPPKPQQPLPPKSWTTPGTPHGNTILGNNMALVGGGGGGEGRESHGSNERIKNLNPNSIVRIATQSPTRQTRLSHQFTPNLGPQTTTTTAVTMINHQPSAGHHVVRYSGSGTGMVNNGGGVGQTTTNSGQSLPAVSTAHSAQIQTLTHSPQASYLQSNMRYHSTSSMPQKQQM